MKDFLLILENCKNIIDKKVPVVVCAEEENVLDSICKCVKENIVKTPILIGNEEKIKAILNSKDEKVDKFEIVNILDSVEASEKAVEYIIKGKGNFLVKGLVDTSVILKSILNRKEEFSEKNQEIFLSHVAIAKVDKLDRLILISDAAMNIAPSVKEKIKIVENALKVSKVLEIKNPKVAMIAAKEKVSPKMIATLDAKEVENHYKNSEIIVEGPLALDNALSKEAAKIKGLTGEIQGDADILIMPSIEAGNVLYKSLTYLSNTQLAGILIGAKIPIVITSRADSEESKFLSIALAALF